MRQTQTPTAKADWPPVVRNIRAELAHRGLSQEALAALVGWDQRRVSRRLTGDVDLTITELERIAAALDVPVSQLLPAEVAK